MASEREWQDMAKGLLKAEMKRRGLTYEQLSARLADLEVRETAVNIRNKVARGGFSAAFLLQCLSAMECDTLDLSWMRRQAGARPPSPRPPE